MSDMLTITEIEAQFISEWVLVEDPQTNDALEVQSGKVSLTVKTGMRSIAKRCGCDLNGLRCSTPGTS